MVKTKEKRHTKVIHQQFTLFLFSSTGNRIGDTGATSISKALKTNTALTHLNLNCEHKRMKPHKRHPSANCYFTLFSTTVSLIGDAGTSSLRKALKSNTTLTELGLGLSCEDKRKKTYKRRPSTNHSFACTEV